MEKYTLIITEKPNAALKIALALNEEREVERKKKNGVPYYVIKREKKIVVVPAIGHLYTVKEWTKGRNYYPIFNLGWVPRHFSETGAKHIKNWIKTISRLANNADTFIDACDYDMEGSLIGYCVMKYACGTKENISKRMKYSTLTQRELKESYERLLPHLDFALIEAGKTRHETDWLYGVNLSRALTLSAKRRSGKYSTLSTGRVQGPTLKFLVSREKKIKSFVPLPYWEVKLEIKIGKQVLKAEYEEKRIGTKKKAGAILNACKKRVGYVRKIVVKKYFQNPPVPFNLGTLQREAYRLFGYTPQRTSIIAQQLYLAALISYPRTSSQKLPSRIGYREILRKLGDTFKYRKYAERILEKRKLKPREGKLSDPAHPAIFPTGEKPSRELSNSEKRLFDLIARRFMAVFSEPAEKQTIKITIDVNKHHFLINGKQTLKPGWLYIYKPYVKSEETLLPPMKEGQKARVQNVLVEEEFTKPPPRYNPGSLLKKMEETGIGTKATRANIIQTLYRRNYIQGRRVEATEIGLKVSEILERYCPNVVSIKLTKTLENKIFEIQNKCQKRTNVLVDAVEILKPAIEKLKTEDDEIGGKLSLALEKTRLKQRIVGTCPSCDSGELMILHSRKTKKRFIGCSNYFQEKCSTSFPLPQKDSVKPSGVKCSSCGWPIIQVQLKRRRPWMLCFNPSCLSRNKRKKKTDEMHSM